MFKRFVRRSVDKPSYLLLAIALIMLVIGGVNYVIMIGAQTSIAEQEALRIAEVVTSQAIASRNIYAATIIEKLAQEKIDPQDLLNGQDPKAPLPARFFKLVGHEASANSNLYSYRHLSKWNLDPAQGLQDDFQRWAWEQLERQDEDQPGQAINWHPIWRIEPKNGERTFRYMRADPASSKSCIHCHNILERSANMLERRASAGTALGKEWKLHQLLGAIEVDIPLDGMRRHGSRHADTALALGLAVSLCGIALAAWVALRGIREERMVAAYYEQQTKFDPLTRLGNRILFNERGQAALAKAAETGSQLAVFFLDLDHFKQINDTYGHHVGDQVLRELSARLTQCIRETDLITRQGGDEFLILLEGGSHRPNFELLAEKVLAEAAKPFESAGDQPHHVSASIGISYFPQHGSDLDTLVTKADVAMYQAKRLGRNKYCLWNHALESGLSG